MKYIQKLFTSRDNEAEADSYVGQTGRIWWDPITNSFYYSDGVTPGGFQIGGGAAGNPAGLNTQVQFNKNNVFGASAGFTYDDSTQTAAVTNFASTGNINFTTTSNVSLGGVANLHIDGGLPDYVLTTDGAGNLTWAVAGGDTPAAGSNTQIQYNNNNAFGSEASFTYNDFTHTASVTNFVTTGNVNFNSTANVGLGSVSNVHIGGGSPDYVLSTDGTGNLSWAISGGATPPAGLNTQIQYNNNNAFGSEASFTYNQTTHTASVTNFVTTGNVNFNSASNVSIGSVSNIHIPGGIDGYYLQTDGSGNLSWAAGGGGGGGSPGGSNTEVQFNNAGTFGGNSHLTFNSTTNTLVLNGNLITNSLQLGSGVSNFCVITAYSATTITSTPHQTLWSIPTASITGVDFVIIATNLTTNSRQTSKITSMILGTTIVFNEYSGLQINNGVGTFYVGLYEPGPDSYLILTVSPDSASTTTYDMMITQYRAV